MCFVDAEDDAATSSLEVYIFLNKKTNYEKKNKKAGPKKSHLI